MQQQKTQTSNLSVFKSLILYLLISDFLEHRNMPLEDALILIMKNFEGYMRGDKLGAPGVGNMERHPENMQVN